MKRKRLLAVMLIVVILVLGTCAYLFRTQTIFSAAGISEGQITSIDFYATGQYVDGHPVLDTVITDKTELDDILNMLGKIRVRRSGLPFALQGGYTHSITFFSGKREVAQFWYGGIMCKYGMWAYSVVQNMSADEQAMFWGYFTKTVQQ